MLQIAYSKQTQEYLNKHPKLNSSNTMKTVALIITLCLTFSISAFAQQPIDGIWLTNTQNTKVQTYKKEGKWFGKIVSSDNPNSKKVEVDILRDFEEKDGVWEGQLYIPARDKLLDATIDSENDKLEIEISIGLFHKTVEWTRTDSCD